MQLWEAVGDQTGWRCCTRRAPSADAPARAGPFDGIAVITDSSGDK